VGRIGKGKARQDVRARIVYSFITKSIIILKEKALAIKLSLRAIIMPAINYTKVYFKYICLNILRPELVIIFKKLRKFTCKTF